MKDFLGNEIHIGDMVVALRYQRTSAELYKAEVLKITPKMVQVQTNYKFDPIRYVYPKKIVVITKKDGVNIE